MQKKIIICCDGTWNKPGQLHTNVHRISELILDNEKQSVHYFRGVGSGNNILDKLFGGIFGSGLNEKIKEAYKAIVDSYEEGDDIYLFGFSRGAYTARSVAGFIRNCGILKKEHAHNIHDAFCFYKSGNDEDNPDSDKMKNYRKRYSHPLLNIKFIGVWDTVGALGVPSPGLSILNNDFLELGFHDLKLSIFVQNAFHALAIDERRKIFNAALWESSKNNGKPGFPAQRIEQVWFPGVHSNIGGGYLKDKLCNTTLLWMIDRAIECGLEFDNKKVIEEVARNLDFQYAAEESYKSFYTIISPFTRTVYKRRDTFEMLHHSALDRFSKKEKYRPGNLLHAVGSGIPIDYRPSAFISGPGEIYNIDRL